MENQKLEYPSTSIYMDNLQDILNQNNTIINLTGRQRMLSQKIGFYCEMILHGNSSKVKELEKTIQLFEKSLQVIKNGGKPPLLETNVEVLPLDESLYFSLSMIENNWSIYKKSAENIIKFATLEYDNSEISKEVMNMQIRIIENNGESLLNSCNNLVNGCSEYYKFKILELYNQQ